MGERLGKAQRRKRRLAHTRYREAIAPKGQRNHAIAPKGQRLRDRKGLLTDESSIVIAPQKLIFFLQKSLPRE